MSSDDKNRPDVVSGITELASIDWLRFITAWLITRNKNKTMSFILEENLLVIMTGDCVIGKYSRINRWINQFVLRLQCFHWDCFGANDSIIFIATNKQINRLFFIYYVLSMTLSKYFILQNNNSTKIYV